MGSSASNDYCAFTKAVEHLGDRWSLLIVREIAIFGPQGFNSLAKGLPGHISRSVLTDKLRKLEELELIVRYRTTFGTLGPYRLTHAGERLRPVIHAMVGWAEKFVPENPALAQRDPDIIIWWLINRIDRGALPPREVVLDIDLLGAVHGWLVLRADADPEACVEDPLLADERYVYIEADATGLYPVARGLRTWADAMEDGSVRVYGDPVLVAALEGWFLGTLQPMREGSSADGGRSPNPEPRSGSSRTPLPARADIAR
jgi:DNA-binding HxlR family transcriptional regulator